MASTDLSIDIAGFNEEDRGIARLVSGDRNSLVGAVESDNRILNALSLPATRPNSSMPSWLASCQVAWDNTSRTIFDVSASQPISHIFWGLAGTKGAATFWHMDASGLATAIHCTSGKKLWIVRKRSQDNDSSVGHYLSSFDQESGQKDSEAIIIDNSMTL